MNISVTCVLCVRERENPGCQHNKTVFLAAIQVSVLLYCYPDSHVLSVLKIHGRQSCGHTVVTNKMLAEEATDAMCAEQPGGLPMSHPA